MLQPALDQVQSSVNGLHLEKWKIPNQVRDDTAGNVESIRRDIQTTLPSLLATADAKPDSVAAVLPVFRNVDALYDVCLRVAELAQTSAPRLQADALNQARTQLQNARRSLGERLQGTAESQEQRLADVESVLKSRASAAATAPAPVCPPATPAAKKKRRSAS